MLHPLASLWRYPARVIFYHAAALAGHQHFSTNGLGLTAPMATQRRFSSFDEAMRYVRYWAGEPAACAELKSMLQRSNTALVSNHAGADGWMHALAGRLAAGTIVVMQENAHLGRPGRLVAPVTGSLSGAAIAALPLLSELAPPTPPLAPLAEPVSVPTEALVPEDATVIVDAPSTSQGADSPEAAENIAQAATLEQAAVTGAPLREIRASQTVVVDDEPLAEEDEQLAEEDGPEASQQIAQAETLEHAAITGTPFCELCAQRQTVEQNSDVIEQDSFEQADQLAQAEILEQAAVTGTPFCEICAKRQQEEQDSHELDQLAQAQTLEQAAVDGRPFCEICAKHQLEQE